MQKWAFSCVREMDAQQRPTPCYDFPKIESGESMKRAWEITQLAFVWLLIAIGFLAVFRVWGIIARATGSSKDFWDVTTAIGTCAAVVVALYVASMQNKKTHKDAIALADVIASAIYVRMGMALGNVHAIYDSLTTYSKQQNFPRKVLVATADILGNITPLTHEDIQTLIPLPNYCAHNLASAFDRIKIAERVLRTAYAISDGDEDVSSEKLYFACNALREATVMLERATQTIQLSYNPYMQTFSDVK
ncbi:hypothetical protein [Burkholderia gladioli]|uniref:hypothetical protein n=1 Tax=Burkholderia gladioli TaxID=28095 RepID=UPI00163E965C|nr:hypothetical protein [Burkholderia gladioli]